MAKVLNNIRVVDMTRYVAGPMCTAQLADLGADVIHVEDVAGGEDRSPLPVDPDYPGGAGFIQVNLWRSALTVTNYFLVEELLTGIRREGTGNRAPFGGPADLAKTRDGAKLGATLVVADIDSCDDTNALATIIRTRRNA